MIHRLAGALGIALALVGATSVAAKERSQIVRFKPGATSTVLKGSVKGYDTDEYRLATVAGQTMHVLYKSKPNCILNISAPGKTDGVAHNSDRNGNEFGANISTAGEYRLSVGQMRAIARRGQSCGYEIAVELTGAPGGASAGVADIVMIDSCKGEAASMYGVQPRAIKVGRIVAANGGFQADGTVNKGADGIKKMRCIFTPRRELDRVMAMTPDGY